jgi:hypothetical protein
MFKAFALLLVAALSLAGCSVGMALSGNENPDLGAVKVGSTRGEVEMQLGSPVRSSSGENGTRIDIYEYEIGNEPSAGRAVAHGLADVLTLGLWEIAGTPIEAVQGETYQATVSYDDQERVIEIKTRKTGSS